MSTCFECKVESKPNTSIHEEWCSQSETARQERNGRGRRMEVNGESAVVLDGQTGAPLLEVPTTDDSVLAALARALEKEAVLKTAANKAKNAFNHAHKETVAAAEHAAAHYASSRQVEMSFTVGGTEPEDE